MLTHRNIYLHALSVIASGRTSRDVAASTSCESVMLHTIPLFHANGWGLAHTVTLVGGTHVMVHQFVPADVFRLIEREKVTNCCLVPTMATALVNCPDREKYDISSLHSVMIGGAASAPTLVRDVEDKLGCACISGYGLTETAPVLTVSSIKKGVPCDDETGITSAPAPAMRFPASRCASSMPSARTCPAMARPSGRSWPAVTSSWTGTGTGRTTR